ncbi:MAG: hypothetical protein ABH874_05500 [Methanobacteriota archaeon]
MGRNEIRARMDVYKLGMQAVIGLLFALILQALSGKLPTVNVLIMLYLLIFIGWLIRKYLYFGKQLDELE